MNQNRLSELEDTVEKFQTLTPAKLASLQRELREIVQNGSADESEKAKALLAKIDVRSTTKDTSQNSPVYQHQDDNVKDLLEQADDRYYAGEYGNALNLYERVLDIEPRNEHAKIQIGKAELLKSEEALDASVPRKARQAFRRARSYVNAGDVQSAARSLDEALEHAEASGVSFYQAQALHESLQDAIVAAEFLDKAKKALASKEWLEATKQLHYAVRLDSTNSLAKTLLQKIQELYAVLDRLTFSEKSPGDLSEQINAYREMRSLLDAIDYNLATKELHDAISQRLHRFSQNIAKQYARHADALLDQGERAVLINTKAEKFQQAQDAFALAESLSSDLIDPVRQSQAENQSDIAHRYQLRISNMRSNGEWKREQLSLDEVRAWAMFAPNDPDVRQALTVLGDIERQKETKQTEKHFDVLQKKIYRNIGLGIGITLLVVIIGFVLGVANKTIRENLIPTSTITPSPTIFTTSTATIAPSPTFTATHTMTPIPTATPYPFGLVTSPTGVFDAPNGNQIGVVGVNQIVTIWRREEFGSDVWFFCKWENNGIRNEGWIRNKLQVVSGTSP